MHNPCCLCQNQMAWGPLGLMLVCRQVTEQRQHTIYGDSLSGRSVFVFLVTRVYFGVSVRCIIYVTFTRPSVARHIDRPFRSKQATENKNTKMRKRHTYWPVGPGKALVCLARPRVPLFTHQSAGGNEKASHEFLTGKTGNQHSPTGIKEGAMKKIACRLRCGSARPSRPPSPVLLPALLFLLTPSMMALGQLV